jgi:hypothetical protein
MFHFPHKILRHNTIHMNDSCFIHVIPHCKQLTSNYIHMNDSMNLHPSSYHSENQQNTNEGEKLSFIRNYTDYVNVIYEMKHFGCFFRNKNAFVSSLSAEKCTEIIGICAEKCKFVV